MIRHADDCDVRGATVGRLCACACVADNKHLSRPVTSLTGRVARVHTAFPMSQADIGQELETALTQAAALEHQLALQAHEAAR